MITGFEDLYKLASMDYMMCKAAENCFPDEFAVRGALYHLQQSIEKALKALILYNGGKPQFTHDIDNLVNHCKMLGEDIPEELLDVADSITFWESKTRYDPFISFSQKKYERAKAMYEWLDKRLEACVQSIGIVYCDDDELSEENIHR